MNRFLATLAALVATESLNVNRAQEAKLKASATPAFEPVVKFLVGKYRNWNSDVSRNMAEALSLLDPKYSGLKAAFDAEINNPNGVVYEPLTVLTSLRNTNHGFIPGSQFLVIDQGRQYGLASDGKVTQYSIRKEDTRLANDEEIARYFSSMTDAHLAEFAKYGATCAFLSKTGEKLAEEASAPKKKDKGTSASPAASVACPAAA